ncbi:MAG: excinuclease ABC subunit UvrA [Deltaproteobacteria bacterium]|nr:excinuclease ABC subunit UvrA [Deltaproteobacteria bacterium]
MPPLAPQTTGPVPPQPDTHIRLRGAREHNLKGVDIDIPKRRLVVVTGPSGSGKSSLAFDTIFAEGQRRYIESLSTWARQFLGQLKKPACDQLTGLSPTIAIEQRTTLTSPRSTVGTVTEIHDYLRVLFARAGVPHCPTCGAAIQKETPGQMVETILAHPEGTRLALLAPLVRNKAGDFKALFEKVRRDGFARARVDGTFVELDAEPPRLAPKKPHTIELVVDRLIVKDGLRGRLTDSLETALKFGGGVVVLAPVARAGEAAAPDLRMSVELRCDTCERDLPELTPQLFSFNAPTGACPDCGGLGVALEVDPEKLVPDPSLSLDEGAIAPWAAVLADKPSDPDKGKTALTADLVDATCKRFGIARDAPFESLTAQQKNILLYGTDELIAFSSKRAHGKTDFQVPFEGIARVIERRFRETRSESQREHYQAFMSSRPCKACGGARLREEARAVRFAEETLPVLAARPLTEVAAFFDQVASGGLLRGARATIAADATREVASRLRFLVGVGLGYLSLDRAARTLSGGESQRIRLASQIGSELTGLVYVLDEPSVGLHPRDTARLVDALVRLRDLGNSVLVVEHDEQVIRAADWVIDMGPGAGTAGGEVVAESTPEQLADQPRSVTGPWLAGLRRIPSPPRRRTPSGWLEIKNARENNLKGIDARIPLGVFVAVTGVSGAGKSTLINDILEPTLRRDLHGAATHPGAHDRIMGLAHLERVVTIDQSPIGRSPRSNPATYTKLFDELRTLFAATKDAKARGFGAPRFSFNVKGGRCEACLGDGVVKVEMHFLPDVWVTCEVCAGRRFNEATLGITWRGLNIAEVLDLPIREARDIFASVPRAARVLDTLEAVGLGYLRLGQAATTLSGGEAQRMKLARELSRGAGGKTIYILDEPTTGLHFEDVDRLVAVLERLVDQGDTVLVVEHQMDLVCAADWVIDLGPDGGAAGGTIVAQGRPEEVARVAASHTGRVLADLLARHGAS